MTKRTLAAPFLALALSGALLACGDDTDTDDGGTDGETETTVAGDTETTLAEETETTAAGG
jgi:hypothetical protein